MSPVLAVAVKNIRNAAVGFGDYGITMSLTVKIRSALIPHSSNLVEATRGGFEPPSLFQKYISVDRIS